MQWNIQKINGYVYNQIFTNKLKFWYCITHKKLNQI